MSIVRAFCRTPNEVAPLVLRVCFAVVMFPHGLQKVFGLYGGQGIQGTMQSFTDQLHIPPLFAFLAIVTEFIAPLLLAVGLLTRLAALALGIQMTVAALMVHVKVGFFMNWFGTQQGEGFEYHILAVAIALALVLKGGGAASLDSAIVRGLEQRPGARQEHARAPIASK